MCKLCLSQSREYTFTEVYFGQHEQQGTKELKQTKKHDDDDHFGKL